MKIKQYKIALRRAFPKKFRKRLDPFVYLFCKIYLPFLAQNHSLAQNQRRSAGSSFTTGAAGRSFTTGATTRAR
jgi:hypothetical protein